MKFTVETVDFRRALRAVVVHASPDKDFVVLHRVRLTPGNDVCTVSATNRYTVGHALVSVQEWDGDIGSIDLSPRDVAELLTLFRAPGKDEPEAILEIEATSSSLTVTDVGGFFAGKSLTLPAYAQDDNFPHVDDVIRGTLVRGASSTERLVTNGEYLTLFAKAGAAYAEPLVFDPAGKHGAMLITCGESFIGLLMPVHQSDEATAQVAGWHQDWMARIDRAAAALV